MNTRKLSFEAIMDMSPEELAKVSEADLREAEEAAAQEQNHDDTQDDEQDHDNDDHQSDEHDDEEDERSEDDEDDSDQQDDEQDEEDTQDDQGQEDDQSGEQGTDESDDNDQDNQTAEQKKEVEKDPKKETTISAEDAEKYKQFFDNVTTEFKANGKAFSISDPADIISLMQKGLNYNQKMAAIKPYFGLIEVMKEHGITDAASIGYLIDLKNKKPEAIAKLVQESGIDTYDLNEDKAKGYIPSEVDVSPQRAEIAAIERDYENDEDFGIVLNELKTWDLKAKESLNNEPAMIRMLIEHKKSGIFDQIIPVLQREMMLGKVTGNTLEAYDNIGRAMFAAAQQDQGEAQAQQQANQQQQHHVPTPAKNLKEKQEKLDAAKKAASMTRTPRKQAKDAKPQLTEEQIFNMTPEELAKVNPKYL